HWRRRTGSSCGDERTAGGRLHLRRRPAVALPWLFLPRRRRFNFVGAFARTPVAVARTVTAIAAVSETVAAVSETIAAVASAVVAVAITLRPAHHRRRALFVLLDPDGEVAQHVFVEAFEPLDLVDRGRRCIDVHEGEMRLPVLAQPVRQRFDAPIFVFGDGSAETLDDAFQLCGQFLDLLRAGVLARKIDVLVERHECPFLMPSRASPPSPSSPSGKARML